MLFAFAGPLTSLAYGQVEVAPFVASYYPLSTLNERTDVPLPSFQGTPPGTIKREQDNGPMVGARLSTPLSGNIRLEGELGLAFSNVSQSQVPRDSTGAGLTVRQSARVFLGSARAVIRPRRQNFYGLAGVGIVARGGDAWKGVDQKAKLAGVLGVGVRAAVNPKLSLTFSAESYIYSFSLNSAQLFNSDSKLQADLVVAVGVPIGSH